MLAAPFSLLWPRILKPIDVTTIQNGSAMGDPECPSVRARLRYEGGVGFGMRGNGTVEGPKG